MEHIVSPFVYGLSALAIVGGLGLCRFGVGFICWRLDCIREAMAGE